MTTSAECGAAGGKLILISPRTMATILHCLFFISEIFKEHDWRNWSENKTNGQGIPSVKFLKNMIGEIKSRSTYLSAIKSDVETQGELFNYLAKQVGISSFTTIFDVEEFVKWLDKELSYLVDDRAVLKHFPQWPERKADALYEATFSHRDLKNLEYEVSTFKGNPKQYFV